MGGDVARRLPAFGENDVATQGRRRLRQRAAAFACNIARKRLTAGFRLVPGGQTVADSCNEEAHGRLDDQRGVDQHDIRVARIHAAEHHARVVVENRNARHGRVGRGDGRRGQERQVEFDRRGARHVDGRAAAETGDELRLRRADRGHDLVEARAGAMTGEGVEMRVHGVEAAETRPHGTLRRRVDQAEHAAAIARGLLSEQGERAASLHIAAGKNA